MVSNSISRTRTLPTPYTAPAIDLTAFNCPMCHAFARVVWYGINKALLGGVHDGSKPYPTPVNSGSRTHNTSNVVKDCWLGECSHCDGTMVWVGGVMIYPASGLVGPEPAEDMPESVRSDFEEARKIAGDSPRGAAALLRLSVQRLCKELGEKGENINDDIGSLVKKGLPIEVQEALDTVRVVGNNAVHPGVIAFDDDVEIAVRLMEIVNYAVDAMITQPKKRKALFAKVPASAKAAIEKRDAPKK